MENPNFKLHEKLFQLEKENQMLRNKIEIRNQHWNNSIKENQILVQHNKDLVNILEEFMNIDTIQNPNYVMFDLERVQKKYKKLSLTK